MTFEPKTFKCFITKPKKLPRNIHVYNHCIPWMSLAIPIFHNVIDGVETELVKPSNLDIDEMIKLGMLTRQTSTPYEVYMSEERERKRKLVSESINKLNRKKNR